VERIVITKEGQETELKRANGDKWTLVKPEQIRVKSQVIRQGLINLTNLTARQILDDPQKEGDPYGLDNPAEKIMLSGNNLDQTLLIGKTGTKEARPGSTPDRYVRVQGHDTVYLVDGRVLQEIKTDPRELQDRSLLTFKPLEIQKVEIELGGKKWVAVQGDEKKWTMEQPEKKPIPDTWLITGILWDLKDLEWKNMIKPMPQDPASVHLDKPRLVVSLFRKDNKEPLALKAGWAPVSPKKEGDKQAEAAPQTTPAEKADTAAPAPTSPPGSVIPPTINAIVQPHEEDSAMFVVDSGFIERLKGDLEKLTEKK
jgi:hypothetical protein